MITIDDFKDYCKNNGFKPFLAKALHSFVQGVKSGTLVKCECCGDIVEEEHTRDSSAFDNPICLQCKIDGN